ncbi:DUF5977 domain-containing protein [uncultured Pedobacter sp.]|uniref:DUF5977 domain-containing protein n=1 Tax=uncultured Pedobacter sp. TaxID=246139 RepID=UPI0025FE0033|nr:DUF5977 domain-containing protein [uncultured Pedobacter sp.]
MKKILLTILILFNAFAGFTQATINAPSSITSGNTFNLTASGENSGSYIFGTPYVYHSPTYTTTPANQSVSFSTIQQAGYPYSTSGQPSKFSMSINTTSSSAVTVTFNVRFQIGNNSGGVFPTVDKLLTVTVNPSVTTYYNTAKSGSFTRNNCGAGLTGSTVTYTVPANTPSCNSNISQADADTKAQNLLNANGQAYANANGVCNQTYYNTAITSNFSKNDCPVYANSGPSVPYTVPGSKYSSTISQEDADAKAQAEINANGQANANANGTCINKTTMTITYTNQGYSGASITRFRVFDNNGTLLYDFNEAQLIAGQEIPRSSAYTFVLTTSGNTDTWKSLEYRASDGPTTQQAQSIVDNNNSNTYTFSGVNVSNSYLFQLFLYSSFA